MLRSVKFLNCFLYTQHIYREDSENGNVTGKISNSYCFLSLIISTAMNTFMFHFCNNLNAFLGKIKRYTLSPVCGIRFAMFIIQNSPSNIPRRGDEVQMMRNKEDTYLDICDIEDVIESRENCFPGPGVVCFVVAVFIIAGMLVLWIYFETHRER